MRHIGESRIYVVPELSTDNEQWINPDFGSPDLRTHYDNIRQMVKEKTGRAMRGSQQEDCRIHAPHRRVQNLCRS